jgi:23S rRNA pseudouridine1911/1915/1917 synthase
MPFVVIPPSFPRERLDKTLAKLLNDPSLSRARIQSLIRSGDVTLGGNKITDPDYKVSSGDEFVLTLPPPEAATPQAEKIPLDIVYEDRDVIVVNKPAGLVVHPAAGNREHTLVNALLAHCSKSLSGIGGVARPGIVHRLDKDTSGLMVVAKNDAAHHKLSSQFADRTLGRLYEAVVWGVPSPLSGKIEGAIGRSFKDRKKMTLVSRGGKEALTYYEVKEIFGDKASLVVCRLATGRTHQIRVHMAHIKHPLIGDPLYGWKKKAGLPPDLAAFPRQALHAFEIHFVHPRTGKPMKFKAPRPEDMVKLFKSLKKLG